MPALTPLSAGAVALSLLAATAAAAQPAAFNIDPGVCSAEPVSGRMLVFAKPITGAAPTSVDTGQLDPRETAIAAQEVHAIAAGKPVLVDADVVSFPQAFSSLAPGRYAVQAVLDRDHSYAYSGRGPGDCVSEVAVVALPAAAPPRLTLQAPLPTPGLWTPSPRAPAEIKAALIEGKPFIRELSVSSPSLTAFSGRPTAITGWVVLPPGYREGGRERYPVVFQTHGFTGTHARQLIPAAQNWALMKSGATPPMIWVVLDQHLPTGTHEFADSVNNGPWGQALTTELIPAIDRMYRTDAKPSGRFVTGHSSGGWAALWLQVRYPALFGGSWPTSPDPADFHDFTGADIYAPNANVYRAPDGAPRPLIRMGGKVIASLEDFTRLEGVLGDYGGQQDSFDWVFSPRGEDGRPLRMFDRVTGKVDPAVAAYWREHYDVAERYRRNWPALKRDLDGKLHLTVGTADTFYLDGAARRLETVMKGVGAKTDFRYLEGRDHFDLYQAGDDRNALLKAISWEMYAVARPGAKRP
jgi:hypothetical protein